MVACGHLQLVGKNRAREGEGVRLARGTCGPSRFWGLVKESCLLCSFPAQRGRSGPSLSQGEDTALLT